MECKREDDSNDMSNSLVHDHPYAGMSSVFSTVVCLSLYDTYTVPGTSR